MIGEAGECTVLEFLEVLGLIVLKEALQEIVQQSRPKKIRF